MENKRRKFIVILGTQKGANSCLKCTKIVWRPDPLGELKRFPRPLSRNRGGHTSKGEGVKEKEEGREGRGRKGKEAERRKGGEGRDCPLTLSPGSASDRGRMYYSYVNAAEVVQHLSVM